jgi:hypothetical protein
MKLHLKVVNDELARIGSTAQMAKGKNHFYFCAGEAEAWIERSVGVRTINTLTLKQWVAEFRRLKALNEQMLRTMGPEAREHPPGTEPPGDS